MSETRGRTSIDETIARLDELVEQRLDSLVGGNPKAPSITVPVTYTRDRLLMSHDGVDVWTLAADHGNARGLVWVEHDGTAEVIESCALRTRFPQVERRHDDDVARRIAAAHPLADRRAA